ncbi:MAG TPA: efflux RND transporter permease subunit [Candidatus Baltobacteraceae bacterium]|jgi:HAE1 family hydrophobic/amphiphilic exporter-1
MRLTQLFVRRPSLVVVVCALVALAGTVATATLVQQNFPNIDFPSVFVSLSYPGASPTEFRDAIVRPIENAIAGAPNLDHMNSSIQNGQGSIAATFSLDSNQTTDLVEVQRRVESTRSVLPNDLSPPSIRTFDPGQATVVTLSISSRTLTRAALSAIVTNNLVPEIEQIDGVSNVNANGTVAPAIEVYVDPKTLSSSGFVIGDVVQAISNNNLRAPGGLAYGADRETSIDVRGDVTDVASVVKLPLYAASAGSTGAASLTGPQGGTGLRGVGQGAPVGSSTAATSSALAGTTSPLSIAQSASTSTLNPWSVSQRTVAIGDVASVIDASEVQRTYSYVGPTVAISLGVQKATGASEIASAENVTSALPRLRAEYPNISFDVLNNQATYTQQQLSAVYHTIAEGIIFTGIVMLFFLRSWRNAIVVMIAIPTSLLTTLFVMRLANFTIDTISLLAMTLCIGILVDDSIVVLENAKRHFEGGEAPKTAALLARTEMGAAAIVITLVDVVVFLPISFLPGVTGRFLSEFGLVVVVATLTSLAVSFSVTPALAGNWSLLSAHKAPRVVEAFTRGFEAVRTWYLTHVLEWGLRHPRSVMIACVLSVIGAISLIPLHVIGFDFIPPIDRGEIFMQLTFPTGTPLATTNAAIADLTQQIAKIPDVEKQTGTAGSYQAGFGGGVTQGSVGQIHVFLKDKRKHSTTFWATALTQMARKKYARGNPVAIPATGTGGGNAQPIDYNITSDNDDPNPYAARILAVLESTPGIVHAVSNASILAPQVDVVFDRERARALDVDIASAANGIRAAFGGATAAQFFTNLGVKYVQVTYPQSAQSSVDEINRIPVRTKTGQVTYAGDVSKLVQDPNTPLITRTNRQTVVHVSANTTPGIALSNVQRAFLQRVAALHLPNTVHVIPNARGQQQNLAETVSGLGWALILSFTLVYLLMVALYDSYVLPVIIMFAIPVASVGALGSLAIANQTLNLFSLIGTVMLIGLVSKNGILLVDFANHHIRAGVDRYTAIRESAQERFRPIVMTTASMIAGMLPIAIALEPGSEVRRSLGIVVIGGLTSSLLLTLVLVPVAFVWLAPRHFQSHEPPSNLEPAPRTPVGAGST